MDIELVAEPCVYYKNLLSPSDVATQKTVAEVIHSFHSSSSAHRVSDVHSVPFCLQIGCQGSMVHLEWVLIANYILNIVQ